ncbi:MAG: hypothetical protein QHH14_09200 [Clostridiales bacterium]|nr:hypothetical protein [Clostridiales bacterium]
MGRQEAKSRYFQEIARFFFSLRGAPFVLSSRDQMTLSSWERQRVPLGIVFEGINRAFERYRKQGRSRKMPALSFCDSEVRRAFGEYRERRVGRLGKVVTRDEKRKRARAEVERFLRFLPPELSSVKDICNRALGLLSGKAVAEEALEKLEEKLEDLLFQAVPERDRAAVQKLVQAEFKGRPREELEEILRLRLVKMWRGKHKIPHLSLFYY